MEEMVRKEEQMSYWKDKKVFITGCTGIIGGWLTMALLEKGAQIVGLIRNDVPKSLLFMSGDVKRIITVHGNVEDYDLLARVLNGYEIDSCFHLAAQSIVGIAHRSPLPTLRANIMGTWNILEACRQTKSVKRIIIASSYKVYGDSAELPYREDFKLQGLYPYDVSKSCADLLSQAYYFSYRLPVGIARCGNIFGGGDLNFNRIVPDTIRSLIFDKNPVIRSDGTYVRDYIYILDAVGAYIVLAEYLDNEELWGQAFNFASEKPVSVLALVNRIIEISGKTYLKPKVLNIAKGETKEQYLSSEKARRFLNWKPGFSLIEGLKETYRWYESYFEGELRNYESISVPS